MLDTDLKEYIHKAAGIVGVSAGVFGGARVIQNLIPVLRELGLVTILRADSAPSPRAGTGRAPCRPHDAGAIVSGARESTSSTARGVGCGNALPIGD